MKAILDTNLLVAEALSHQEYEVAVSSLSWAELGYGVREVRGRAIDLMIAATAAAHGAAVITRNADDFIGLQGLVKIIAV